MEGTTWIGVRKDRELSFLRLLRSQISQKLDSPCKKDGELSFLPPTRVVPVNVLECHCHFKKRGLILKLHRLQQLEIYIKKQGSVSLEQLCQHFDVSKNTIRRDIQTLEARQVVKKVYGGVVANNDDAPIPLSQRQLTMKSEKTAIAAKAAEFVRDGDIVIVDAGSTTVHLVEYLKTKRRVTLITNSIPAITAAAGNDQLHVIVTGGDLLQTTNSLVGQDAIAMLKRLNAHTAFIAATSVSLDKGITNSSLIETDIKKAMMEISSRRMLLVDHSKFDTVSLVKFAELREFDALITDAPPPPEYRLYCEKYGVQEVVADMAR